MAQRSDVLMLTPAKGQTVSQSHVVRQRSPNASAPLSTKSTDLARVLAEHPYLQPSKGIVFLPDRPSDGSPDAFDRLEASIAKPVGKEAAYREAAALRQWAAVEDTDHARKSTADLYYEHAQSRAARLTLFEQANSFILDPDSFVPGTIPGEAEEHGPGEHNTTSDRAQHLAQTRPYWTESQQEHIQGISDFVLRRTPQNLAFLEWQRHDVLPDDDLRSLSESLRVRPREANWKDRVRSAGIDPSLVTQGAIILTLENEKCRLYPPVADRRLRGSVKSVLLQVSNACSVA